MTSYFLNGNRHFVHCRGDLLDFSPLVGQLALELSGNGRHFLGGRGYLGGRAGDVADQHSDFLGKAIEGVRQFGKFIAAFDRQTARQITFTGSDVDWGGVVSTYIGIPVIFLFYLWYKIKYHTKLIPLTEIDLSKKDY